MRRRLLLGLALSLALVGMLTLLWAGPRDTAAEPDLPVVILDSQSFADWRLPLVDAGFQVLSSTEAGKRNHRAKMILTEEPKVWTERGTKALIVAPSESSKHVLAYSPNRIVTPLTRDELWKQIRDLQPNKSIALTQETKPQKSVPARCYEGSGGLSAEAAGECVSEMLWAQLDSEDVSAFSQCLVVDESQEAARDTIGQVAEDAFLSFRTLSGARSIQPNSLPTAARSQCNRLEDFRQLRGALTGEGLSHMLRMRALELDALLFVELTLIRLSDGRLVAESSTTVGTGSRPIPPEGSSGTDRCDSAPLLTPGARAQTVSLRGIAPSACFRIQVEPRSSYRIYTLGEADSYLQAYNADGEWIAENDDINEDDLNASITLRSNTSMMAYVVASEHDYRSATFQIALNAIAEEPDRLEPNDRRQDASPISWRGEDIVLTDLTILGDDWDYFRLSLPATSGYRFEARCGEFDTVMYLYDESGEQIAENDDSGSGLCSQIVYSPQEQGQVYVAVRAYEENDSVFGTYDLSISAVEGFAPDEYEPNNSRAEAYELTSFQRLDGLTLPPGDQDFFEVRLESDQNYRFETDCGDSDTVLELQNSRGQNITGNDDAGDSYCSMFEFEPDVAGVYYLMVRNYQDVPEEPASYSLIVEEVAPLVDDRLEPNDEPETASRLEIGEIDNLNIRGSDRDYFSFRLRQDERLSFRTICTGDTVIDVMDTAGRVLDSDDDGGDQLCSQLLFTAQSTGLYYLVVRNYSDEGEATYSLVSEEREPVEHDRLEPNNAFADATPIELGTYENLGLPSRDIDYFVFTTDAMRRYEIESVCGEESDTMIIVFDDGEQEILSNDDAGSSMCARLELNSPVAKRYYILVRNYEVDPQQDTEYDLIIRDLGELTPDVHEPNNEPSNAVELTLGETRQLSIIGRDDDYFAVDLQADHAYEIEVQCEAFDSVLSVADELGAVLAENDDRGSSLCSYAIVRPEVDTKAIVRVYSYDRGDSVFGAYVLSIQDIPGYVPDMAEPNDSYGEAFAITFDENEVMLENLSLFGEEYDHFRIRVDPEYYYELETFCGDSDTVLEIVNQDDEIRAADDDGGNDLCSRLMYFPMTNETITVRLRNYDPEAEVFAQYDLRVTRVEPEANDEFEPDNTFFDAFELPLGESESVRVLSPRTDVDFFQYTPSDQCVVAFDTICGEADTFLTVYDSAGVQVASNDDGGSGTCAYLSVGLEDAGQPYYISVSNYSGSEIDYVDYTLRVQEWTCGKLDDESEPNDGVLEATSIRSGDQLRGLTIFPNDDIDVFTIDAAVGQVLSVATECQNDTLIRILNREGRELASQDDVTEGDQPSNRCASIQYEIPVSGKYFIEVTGFAGEFDRYDVSVTLGDS